MFDKRHNKKFNKRLSDIPTWRLMQELSQRGTLRAIPASANIYDRNQIVVDGYGCPILQQFGDDGLPLFAPR